MLKQIALGTIYELDHKMKTYGLLQTSLTGQPQI